MIFHFNPLPPYGGRLLNSEQLDSGKIHFNPLPPYGGRHILISRILQTCHFNPLPPYGGRPVGAAVSVRCVAFQSTPSVWRETRRCRIHLSEIRHFNPLPPYGGRLCIVLHVVGVVLFQSTPSVWRETAKLHRKAFFISPILVQSCKKGCKRLHSAPEKMIFFEKREKNSVRNLQHLSVRL